MRKVPCVECGSVGYLEVSGKVTYPHRTDLHHKKYWMCDCGAFVSAHRKTGYPMGAPANAETRGMRARAHDAFDPLWSGKHAKMSRAVAYRWLAAKLQIAVQDCHIGHMVLDEAAKVVTICQEYRENER